jgi:hypothetical protein
MSHGHDQHHHEHNHHGHDHDGHEHTHDIYTEDGVEPTVISIERELAPGISPDELANRAERIVRTLTSLFAEKKILIGHIKLRVQENADGDSDDNPAGGLFISATSPNNVTVRRDGIFAESALNPAKPPRLNFGLTVIVFGIPESHAAPFVADITDDLLAVTA